MKPTQDHVEISDMIMSMMGVDRFAYIRPVSDNGEMGYAVYAADGTPLAIFESMDAASASVRKHNLTPVKIH